MLPYGLIYLPHRAGYAALWKSLSSDMDWARKKCHGTYEEYQKGCRFCESPFPVCGEENAKQHGTSSGLEDSEKYR
jgi:hypothetical protein